MAKNIILCGPNGAGKTNILEALSLLAPGRGLRGAKASEIQKKEMPAPSPWTVSVQMETKFGEIQIGTAKDNLSDKRIIHINGQNIKAQGDLGEWLSCLWLTPQMDRLFLDDKTARRRFFDRLVFTFDAGHIGRLTRYENAMRQRLKLLKEGQADNVWLEGLEAQMAETGVAICAARRIFCQKLQQAYKSATLDEKNNFPMAHLYIEGGVEQTLEYSSALNTEDVFKNTLQQNRTVDCDSGMTAYGPHRSDFIVTYYDKQMPAAQSSTGEQKALLIGIILAHARLLHEETGQSPLLLLDEIVAHLDPNRRKILAEVLQRYMSQVWMSGTDFELFSDFKINSGFYSVSSSDVGFFTPGFLR